MSPASYRNRGNAWKASLIAGAFGSATKSKICPLAFLYCRIARLTPVFAPLVKMM